MIHTHTDKRHTGIVIIGAPRSGTTLLRRLINAHPNIACPGETFLLRGGARFLHSELIADGIDYGIRGGLRMSGFTEVEIYRRLREFVTSFHQDYAAERGKKRWAEKTAVDAFYLQDIEKYMGGHAYFIFVLRNGVDVIRSWSSWTEANQKFIEEVYEYIQRYRGPNEAYAHAWSDLTRSMLDFARRRPEDSLIVRYEDLVSDTDSTLGKIFQFVVEPFDPKIVKAALADFEDIGMGDWKTYGRAKIDASSIQASLDMPPEVVSRLGVIMNKQLLDCGYDTLPILGSITEEEAERKYQMSMMYQAMKASESSADN